MAQTLRDWYRYLERQMHVSFPVVPPDSAAPPGPPGRPAGAAVSAAPRRVDGAPRAVLDAEAHAEAVRRRLQAGTDQGALPLELGPRARGRGGRRPITESREEIIRRLLDPELTLYEAAAVLNLSRATVRRCTDQGKVPCLRTDGGQRRFRLSALLTFLDEQTQSRGEAGGA